ncbi:hypothetical protein O181_079678 [Austropuccinia psidii MF-1]|uniref:Uncharacterized protein n=1 Tax=Austropuccinia psidii MF-1 TaxID=1389203 RepID=A0A9Q3IFU2_9BASI|nr:hypothetical protein [Austropuccinia psidii MF-1]
MESLQPIEALNLHESGTIKFEVDIEEIKPSIQDTSHCTPAFLVPNEQFPLITEPDKYDYSTGLKLEPPPLSRFNDVDTLMQFAQKWAKGHGYALTKKNSHKGKNVCLACDQYGEYISLKGPNQRQSTTKICGCKFRLRGSIPSPKDDSKDYQTSWNLLVSSNSTEEYNNIPEKIKVNSNDYSGAWAYISNSLLTFKKKFVTDWTSQNHHLGNQTRSCVESEHSYIKCFINTSNGELSTVFKNFKKEIDIQLNHIHHTMGKERVHKLTDVSPLFKKLLGTISIKAIKIIEEQFLKLKHQPNPQPCSKTLMNGMGIPCSHEIEKLINNKG